MLPKRANLSQLSSHWDLLVIGGGITGAGVALVASQLGVKVLLVEQQDYAWGTSSRSSKMVHGGLRYLSQGAFRLTRESLRERELFLKELPHLVKRMPYYFPVRKGQFPGRFAMGAALWLYDTLAGVRETKWHGKSQLHAAWPAYEDGNTIGAYSYSDALTDDSRLVMRVLQEAGANGAELMNYVEAQTLRSNGESTEATLLDKHSGQSVTVTAKHVINATGAWADQLSDDAAKVRPLRGSHVFLPAAVLPVSSCLTLLHPQDKRPVFVFPWQGSTVVGTTDQDHSDSLNKEAKASAKEIAYLLEVIAYAFPSLSVTKKDIVSTQAGVRPVIASGKGKDPSKERRDHLVWHGEGRVTVSGGKLTTFRVIALDALKAAGIIDEATHRKLYKQRRLFAHNIQWPNGLGDPLAAPPTHEQLLAWWRWAIRHEQVHHLDDLLLRRTHVGNHTANGGLQLLVDNAQWLQRELGWGAERWQQEVERYTSLWRNFYQA